MALIIYEFGDIQDVLGHEMQIAKGAPSVKHSTNGEKVFGDKTYLIRITGDGTITWPNGVAEAFESEQWRGVTPGASITVA